MPRPFIAGERRKPRQQRAPKHHRRTANTRRFGEVDPLLYIESIPYWETRGYVPIVLRNYWIYEQQTGKESSSREALAQGMWPRFPGLPGATAVRLGQPGSAVAAHGSD